MSEDVGPTPDAATDGLGTSAALGSADAPEEATPFVFESGLTGIGAFDVTSFDDPVEDPTVDPTPDGLATPGLTVRSAPRTLAGAVSLRLVGWLDAESEATG